jgi:type I restriction enzyme R subunit
VALLKKHGLTDLSDHDACFDVFYDEDIRFAFMLAFKKLTSALNTLFPAKEALAYMPDYQKLTEINILAGKHFRDARLSMQGIPPKLRAIADAHLVSKGIDTKIAPISILDEDFEKGVKEHKRNKTKAAEVEHAIRHHIDIELDDDPDLQASFAEALAVIFAEFKDNWQKIYEELEKLRQRIKDADKEPTYGLHRKKQMPFFRLFQTELGSVMDEHDYYGDKPDERIAVLVDLTQQIYNAVERELKLTGFWESVPARNKLKSELQQVLLSAQFANVPSLIKKREAIISRVMELAEVRNDIILYAA